MGGEISLVDGVRRLAARSGRGPRRTRKGAAAVRDSDASRWLWDSLLRPGQDMLLPFAGRVVIVLAACRALPGMDDLTEVAPLDLPRGGTTCLFWQSAIPAGAGWQLCHAGSLEAKPGFLAIAGRGPLDRVMAEVSRFARAVHRGPDSCVPQSPGRGS